MKVSIIVIGDELLLGQVTDTNSGDIARAIAPAGWQVAQVATVADDSAAIRNAIEKALAATDVVLTTGGLGPTKDDITKATLIEVFGGELRFDAEVMENVKSIFARRGLDMNRLTESQAMVPTSCTPIRNALGTAPVMWFERNGKVLVAMPGVPFETRHAFNVEVFPRLLKRFGRDCGIEHRTLIVSGITESDLAEKLATFEDALPTGAHLAYLPNPGYIRLRLDVAGNDDKTVQATADSGANELKAILGNLLIAESDLTAEEILLDALRGRGLTVATAESCTGGNIAHRITMIPGASDFYPGSVVSYSNEVKMNLLGVDAAVLEAYGAVSEPVARQMADGARRALGADCAVATSGIAGPSGGSPEKPVGTVCMAFATPEGTDTVTFHFPGDRARVIDRASTTAMIELAKRIKGLQ